MIIIGKIYSMTVILNRALSFTNHDKILNVFILQESSPNNNEKRITIMLIGVVIIFLFCNVPMGCHLLYYHFNEPVTPVESNICKSKFAYINNKNTNNKL